MSEEREEGNKLGKDAEKYMERKKMRQNRGI